MPNEDHYAGLLPSDCLRVFAEHHHDPGNRHINEFEFEMLIGIANLIDQKDRTISRALTLRPGESNPFALEDMCDADD